MQIVNKKNIQFFALIFIIFLNISLSGQEQDVVSGKHGVAATAHPLASQAAIEMLKMGGNAVDAAVAAAFTIGVVEPDGSGIGGGGGMVIYLNKEKKSIYINYYHQAPLNINNINYNRDTDRHTAKSILVPGTVAGLTLALKKYGSLPLGTILKPAIHYAENGFEIDETLGIIILDNVETLSSDSTTASIYLDEGFPLMEGDLLKQPELASTLREISLLGRAGFYGGKVAKKMVKEINERGGVLSLKDFELYQAELTKPLLGSYRGYNILSANAPQSGVSIIEALNMLENVNLKSLGHYTKSAETLHIMAQTFTRIYADRFTYWGDPNFSDVPTKGLISKDYARARFNDINRFKAEPEENRKTKAGNPAKYNFSNSKRKVEKKKKQYIFSDDDEEDALSSQGWGESAFGGWGTLKKKKRKKSKVADSLDVENNIFLNEEEYDGHTTHLSVIDKEGNAVSLTQTLGTFFGSAQTIEGVLFNCGMSNYSTTSEVNMVIPSKRPRSSISPTIVTKDGNPFLIIGSPGASRIISTVIELIVNIIDFGMNVKEANIAPRFYTQKFDKYLHVEDGISESVREKLETMGHSLRVYNGLDLFFGGAQIIYVNPKNGLYYASADPRRGGRAIGY